MEGGSEVEGTPAIFPTITDDRGGRRDRARRSLLGGLISENNNITTAKCRAGRIPCLGRLFGSDTASTERTELVVMMTPGVLDENTRWNSILDRPTANCVI